MRFDEFDLNYDVLDALDAMRFSECTPIQEQSIPLTLEGRDLIAVAQTGTGKTAAYLLPVLNRLADGEFPEDAVNCIVMAPTRELAMQIDRQLEGFGYFLNLSSLAIYGGTDGVTFAQQQKSLLLGADVVIATPGRLLAHLQMGKVDLSRVSFFILDEADRMLDMGFYKDVCKILDRLPKDKQMVMFSATISREVMDIGWLYQRDTVELTVEPVKESEPKITQYMLESTGRQKLADLVYILQIHDYRKVMIFCNTKYSTTSLAGLLRERGFNADCLNGDMRQSERNKIMAAFRGEGIDILVATDVAARGIDVTDVDAVVNYEIPLENEYYTHRIGRTGRAKKEGVSYVFYAPDERKRLDTIIRYTRSTVIELEFNEQNELVEKGGNR